jgi:hypothetical protein
VASNEDFTTRGNRGTISVRTSVKPSLNSVIYFMNESIHIFSDGGRKIVVKFIFSHTYLSIPTDKPVNLHGILPI